MKLEQMQITETKISDLIGADYNPRILLAKEFDDLRASLDRFGIVEPAVVNRHPGRENVIVGGHQRINVARALGRDTFPVVFVDLDEEHEKELNVRLNKNGGRWDFDKLANLFELDDLVAWGFEEGELLGRCDELLDELNEEAIEAGPGAEASDELPEVSENDAEVVSVRGDVWECGRHRVMCGDSTAFGDLEKLLPEGEQIATIYADPPYGMKKEADGVANDNLNDDDLLSFNVEWWRTFRARAKQNANAVIFGNARVLWKWWYYPEIGLEASEPLTFKNEIVWAKGSAQGRGSDLEISFPNQTERALFFNLGKFVSAISRDSSEYFEEWEPLRLYFAGEADRSGLSGKKFDELSKTNGMLGHYTGRSQWSFPTREKYAVLDEFGGGEYFTRSFDDLLREYNRARAAVDAKLEELRGYFCLNNDAELDDVLRVPGVQGDERHGHATPKPVELNKKILKTITKPGTIVAEPFGGSGATLAACEELGFASRTMEIEPRWVDVIVRRWQKQTGRAAFHAETGKPFDEYEPGRE